MSGLFGVVGKKDCSRILFYGTDYHSHLGTQKGGLAVYNRRLKRSIHDLSTSQFKSRFVNELPKMKGPMGIGVISDLEPQPIIISSSFGKFALIANGLLENKNKLAKEIMLKGGSFTELSGGRVNSVEVVGKIIAQKENLVRGVEYLFRKIRGSISLLLLTKEGVYAARDRFGRTTLVIGKKGNTYAVTSETCAFPNLSFQSIKELLPGEIILLTRKGLKGKIEGGNQEKICAFLWIYTGYPASSYEGINVETVRERCGAQLAKGEKIKADYVTGIPDSGTTHALGYAQASALPYRRPLVKYTSGYDRSYTPPSQKIRDQVAQKKLIPIKELIKNKKIVICDDSIVRGTQLKNQAIQKLWQHGAQEIHVRIACPPLMFPCRYCLSTRTKKELAARRAIREILGSKKNLKIGQFLNEQHSSYKKIVEAIRKRLGVTSLKYQTLNSMVKAIGLPKEKLCLYCWNGKEEKKKTKKRIAVLISNKGTGSNLQAIIDHQKANKIKGKIVVVVSDKADAYGLVRAKKNKIPTLVRPFTKTKNKKARRLYGKKLAKELKQKYQVDLVTLAGWMIILPPSFLKYFPNQVINLHPGLIADEKGSTLRLSDGSLAKPFEGEKAEGAIQAALNAGITISGSTTHFITKEVDWGPVIMRAEEKIKPHDSIDSYYARLKKKEHLILPLSVKLFCEDKLKVNGHLVRILDKRYKKHLS